MRCQSRHMATTLQGECGWLRSALPGVTPNRDAACAPGERGAEGRDLGRPRNRGPFSPSVDVELYPSGGCSAFNATLRIDRRASRS